jgi:hypothetical protein
MVVVVKKSYSVRSRLALYVGSVTIFLVLLLGFPRRIPVGLNDELSYFDDAALKDLTEQLQNAASTLRGEDHRLIQWDATEETAATQPVLCPKFLPVATNLIANHSHWSVLLEKDASEQKRPVLYQLMQASLDVAILCITDNPANREIFAETTPSTNNRDTIHNAVVALLRVIELASSAAHLIYIATFANVQNHASFLQAQVVKALDRLLMLDDATPVTIMWAAAALQNLAASYCTTRSNQKEAAEIGRCDWEWTLHEIKQNVPYYDLQVASSQSEIIDGTPVRQAILASPQLVDRLVQWSCRGPVRGRMSSQNPYPGKNARSGDRQHEMSRNIVPWAATGVLKNFVLDSDARSHILLNFNQSLACFCFMSNSRDWLERNKGEGVLHFLHVDSNPCWFDFDSNMDGEENTLCVDRYFVDRWGDTCAGRKSGRCQDRGNDWQSQATTASSECCRCGGGDRYRSPV